MIARIGMASVLLLLADFSVAAEALFCSEGKRC